MSDQKNAQGADTPPPEGTDSPAAFPDLGARTEAPAWLSPDNSHDAGLWDSSFEAPATDSGTETAEADGTPGAEAEAAPAGEAEDIVLPAEPVVVAPEQLTLEEPSLADPALSSDAVEAASLDEVTSEAAAVEANAAEAGRLSGLEPAPAGAQIHVGKEPASEAAAAEGGTDGAPADDADTAAADNGPDANAVADAPRTEAMDMPADSDAAATEGPAEPAAADPAAVETGAPESSEGSTNTDEPADGNAVVDGSADASPTAGDRKLPEEAPKEPESEQPRPQDAPADGPATHDTHAEHPLHGISAAAPLTGALPESGASSNDPASTNHGSGDGVPGAASGSPAPATGALPSTDTRRSRRLAEGQLAGASAARQQPASGNPAAPDGGDGSSQISKDTAGSGRNTRLALVIGGIVLAAVIAILLFVFVFNDKGDGVLDENVSPVELESGACLQDWEDVNSSADVVTCETPHDAQLVATDSFPEDEAFPGTAALEDRVNEVCAAVQYADAASNYPDLKLTKSIPTEQTWADGDRRVDCFVFAPEGQELTESLLRE